MREKKTKQNLTSRSHPCHLGIVVPCYNEEAVLSESAKQLINQLTDLIDARKITPESQIYFVDDGSTDRTWEIIESLAHENKRVAGIKLSRNCGHQHALMAGLLTAKGDAVVSIDADLQQDAAAIEEMVEAYKAGYDVVYGIPDSRKSDRFFKHWSAEAYYRLMRLCGVEVMFNHADYRLLSRQTLQNLEKFSEVNLFLRGIVPLLGLPSTQVCYARHARAAGHTKYPLKKMLAFALDGITSFSVVPLRAITAMGIIIFSLSIFLGLRAVYLVLVKETVPGWASTVIPIYFLGSIQLLAIGIIGEYLAKIYQEVKRRPRYLIEKISTSSKDIEPTN
jgi:glycosyltransferase involved in cell wall biosynthesis